MKKLFNGCLLNQSNAVPVAIHMDSFFLEMALRPKLICNEIHFIEARKFMR